MNAPTYGSFDILGDLIATMWKLSLTDEETWYSEEYDVYYNMYVTKEGIHCFVDEPVRRDHV